MAAGEKGRGLEEDVQATGQQVHQAFQIADAGMAGLVQAGTEFLRNSVLVGESHCFVSRGCRDLCFKYGNGEWPPTSRPSIVFSFYGVFMGKK